MSVWSIRGNKDERSIYLEGDNDETDEDIHHEESDYDDECNEEYGDGLRKGRDGEKEGGTDLSRVIHWTMIFFVRVDCDIEKTGTTEL